MFQDFKQYLLTIINKRRDILRTHSQQLVDCETCQNIQTIDNTWKSKTIKRQKVIQILYINWSSIIKYIKWLIDRLSLIINFINWTPRDTTAKHIGHDPFNQNFCTFWSKNECIWSVQMETFRKKQVHLLRWTTFFSWTGPIEIDGFIWLFRLIFNSNTSLFVASHQCYSYIHV